MVPFHVSLQISNPCQYKGYVVTNPEFLKLQIIFGNTVPIITCLTVIKALGFGVLILG